MSDMGLAQAYGRFLYINAKEHFTGIRIIPSAIHFAVYSRIDLNLEY